MLRLAAKRENIAITEVPPLECLNVKLCSYLSHGKILIANKTQVSMVNTDSQYKYIHHLTSVTFFREKCENKRELPVLYNQCWSLEIKIIT